jgi:hypothetical protein
VADEGTLHLDFHRAASVVRQFERRADEPSIRRARILGTGVDEAVVR